MINEQNNKYIIDRMFGKLSLPQKTAKSAKINPANTFTQPTIEKTKIIAKKKKTKKKQDQQSDKWLKGSKFRMLNELLYTSTSKEAKSYFQNNQQDYDLYHEGFRNQTQKWSDNPVHLIIKYLKNKAGKLILDLGCGDAFIYDELKDIATVRSFDLVSNKDHVEVADISSLPLQSKSADICVFCLSLMGTNYIDFLLESKRVLKKGGELIIGQVESRCEDWSKFTEMVSQLGFSIAKSKTNSFFRLLYFKENGCEPVGEVEGQPIKEYSQKMLSTCLYKKR